MSRYPSYPVPHSCRVRRLHNSNDNNNGVHISHANQLELTETPSQDYPRHGRPRGRLFPDPTRHALSAPTYMGHETETVEHIQLLAVRSRGRVECGLLSTLWVGEAGGGKASSYRRRDAVEH